MHFVTRWIKGRWTGVQLALSGNMISRLFAPRGPISRTGYGPSTRHPGAARRHSGRFESGVMDFCNTWFGPLRERSWRSAAAAWPPNKYRRFLGQKIAAGPDHR